MIFKSSCRNLNLFSNFRSYGQQCLSCQSSTLQIESIIEFLTCLALGTNAYGRRMRPFRQPHVVFAERFATQRLGDLVNARKIFPYIYLVLFCSFDYRSEDLDKFFRWNGRHQVAFGLKRIVCIAKGVRTKLSRVIFAFTAIRSPYSKFKEISNRPSDTRRKLPFSHQFQVADIYFNGIP